MNEVDQQSTVSTSKQIVLDRALQELNNAVRIYPKTTFGANAQAILDEIERLTQELSGFHRSHLEDAERLYMLRAALERYGRHAHPNCHDLTLKQDGSFGPRNGCLCGLDAALSGASSAHQTQPAGSNGEVERLRVAMAQLRMGIYVNATDTVWAGPGETAVDFITRTLGDVWTAEESAHETYRCEVDGPHHYECKHCRIGLPGLSPETPVHVFLAKLRQRVAEIREGLGAGSFSENASTERAYAEPPLDAVLDAIDELEQTTTRLSERSFALPAKLEQAAGVLEGDNCQSLASACREARDLLRLSEETSPKPASIDDLIALGDKFVLPVDVKIGAGTFKKGVPVGTILRCVSNHAQYAIADAYSGEKSPEAHIDYKVPGCNCLGCELAQNGKALP